MSQGPLQDVVVQPSVLGWGRELLSSQVLAFFLLQAGHDRQLVLLLPADGRPLALVVGRLQLLDVGGLRPREVPVLLGLELLEDIDLQLLVERDARSLLQVDAQQRLRVLDALDNARHLLRRLHHAAQVQVLQARARLEQAAQLLHVVIEAHGVVADVEITNVSVLLQ